MSIPQKIDKEIVDTGKCPSNKIAIIIPSTPPTRSSDSVTLLI